MPKQENDPYLYPDTDVLINKFNITNAQALQDVEAVFFALQHHAPLPKGHFDYSHLKAIHHHYFKDIYDWAGKERTVDIAKENSYFAHVQYIEKEINKIFSQLKADHYLKDNNFTGFCKKLAYYFNEINACHPFREGNGRTLRTYCDLLAENAGYELDWGKISIDEYLKANILGFNGNYQAMEDIFLTIASPLQLNQTIENSLTLSSTVEKLMVSYIEKEIELSTLVKLGHGEVNQPTDSHQAHVKQLDKETRKLASSLLQHPEVKELLKATTHHRATLLKQGGFITIEDKMKNHQSTVDDWLAVTRYAQRKIVTLSNTLNKTKKQSR